MTKGEILNKKLIYLKDKGFRIVQTDAERPWGAFFVIDEHSADFFIQEFFPELNIAEIKGRGKISPKILLVAPNKKLSWQYHHRRAEIWKLIEGKAAVIRSKTDKEQDPELLNIGETIQLKQGERHRLVGLDEWGIIAEIWMHTDPDNPSNEDDIVRLDDDFGRGI